MSFGYFANPTPGSVKVGGYSQQADEPGFSHGSGVYPGAFTLILTSAVPGATIRYTADGSVPTASSTAYSPIAINATVRIRARVFAAGMLPGPVRSEHYLLVDGASVNFTSDLPIVVLDIYLSNDSVAVSFPTLTAAGQGYYGLSRSYNLEYLTELFGSWQPVEGATNIPGDNSVITHTNFLNAAEFFRAKTTLQ